MDGYSCAFLAIFNRLLRFILMGEGGEELDMIGNPENLEDAMFRIHKTGFARIANPGILFVTAIAPGSFRGYSVYWTVYLCRPAVAIQSILSSLPPCKPSPKTKQKEE